MFLLSVGLWQALKPRLCCFECLIVSRNVETCLVWGRTSLDIWLIGQKVEIARQAKQHADCSQRRTGVQEYL